MQAFNSRWCSAGLKAEMRNKDMDVLPFDQLPALLTVDEARRVLRLGRNSMYDAVKRGEIPSLRIGRRLFVPKARLKRLLGENGDE